MVVEILMPDALINIVGLWFVALIIKSLLEFVPL